MTPRTQPDSNDVILSTGGYFDIFNPERPDNGKVTLATIAIGLAQIFRYGGQTPLERPLTVAEHSVMVSRMVDPANAREALMHDATEALIGDIRRPLKQEWPEYQAVEARLERWVAHRFGLSYPATPDVKAADRAICWVEQRAIFENTADWGCPPPSPAMIRNAGGAIRFDFLDRVAAAAMFMDRAAELEIRIAA